MTLAILADIGGTNTRVALADGAAVRLDSIRRYPNAEYQARGQDIAHVLRDYLATTGATVTGVCVAAAGPVQDGVATMTNLDWVMDAAKLTAATGARRVAILNDLQAQGQALGHIPAANLRTVIDGPVKAGGSMLVVGLVSGFLIAPLVDMEGNGTAASLGDWAQTNYLVYASDVKHPVEVGKDEKAHLLQWLGKRLGEPVHAPDLGAQGFELIGGRLVTYDGKPAALLMYEDKSGERLTLALGRNSGNAETGFLQTEKGGVRTLHWIDGPVGYGVSGRIDGDRLKAIATLVYEQL